MDMMQRPMIKFDDIQIDAINACCNMDGDRIVAVTGPAGTGKTRIIEEVGRRLRAYGYEIACSAPTGKAARRISDLTGLPAVTNHSLLGYGHPIEGDVVDDEGKKEHYRLSGLPRFNKFNQFPYDVILCDEYAMVNNEIHRGLIDAMKPGSRICMLGDVQQLKPIEEDKRLDKELSIFTQMLRKFKGIILATNHRQEEGSGIAANGVRVLGGKPPKKFPDFDLRFSDQPVESLKKFIREQEEKGILYSSLDTQIITTMHKSWVGTKKLNQVIQTMYWDRSRPYLDLERHRWEGMVPEQGIRIQVGTKVVYTANSYDLGYGHFAYNGEVGHVAWIDDMGAVTVRMFDRTIVVPPLIVVVTGKGKAFEQDPRKNLDLAYVLTTHKMQGSECDHICYIMNKSTIFTQSRRNLYTGITRARKFCTIITDQPSITKSIRNPG